MRTGDGEEMREGKCRSLRDDDQARQRVVGQFEPIAQSGGKDPLALLSYETKKQYACFKWLSEPGSRSKGPTQ